MWKENFRTQFYNKHYKNETNQEIHLNLHYSDQYVNNVGHRMRFKRCEIL